jgi:uncharacterized protein YlzI (FlbEa/FlbD family)
MLKVKLHDHTTCYIAVEHILRVHELPDKTIAQLYLMDGSHFAVRMPLDELVQAIESELKG